jgi:hypothetical protein
MMNNLAELLLTVVLPYLVNTVVAAAAFFAIMWLRWRAGQPMLLPAENPAGSPRS